MSNQIIVSGVGVPQAAIAFPSGQINIGQPGSNLSALLIDLNTSFGFNLTPHNFQTSWVPTLTNIAFHGASGNLPAIGQQLDFYVGEFLVRGNVVHADYTASTGGTIIKITIEDQRRNLRRIKIHTEDIGENIPSGVVSVARTFRKINGLTENGNPADPLIKEYDKITEFGFTYNQFLAAIDYTFNEGKISYNTSILPTVEQLETNIGNGSADAIRFQFNLSQLDETITRILQDYGFDWYWSLDGQRINIINKRIPFILEEDSLLDIVSQFGSSSGINETTQIGFGQDIVSEPTRFRVLGGHQEGFINSKLLSPIDGLETSQFDGKIVFEKIWDKLSIGFFDAGGFYRTYTPTEKELQLALAGIETWSYFKRYQSNLSTDSPPGFGLPPDNGSIAAQDPSFQSRIDPLMPIADLATGAGESGLRIISNRRDAEHNWTLTFFDRVQDHASRHYGRSFIIENLLYNQISGLYRPSTEAWANVENQVQGYPLSSSGTIATSGIFVDDYEINRALGPISPFITNDFRVAAHCVFPSGTIYGPQGNDVPASFGNWTEDAPPFNPSGDGSHYVPVTLTIVGQKIINPRSDDLYSFEAFPEGTLWCQLPIITAPDDGLSRDDVIASLATLANTNIKLNSSGFIDLLDPARIINPYTSLSGVAIPVQGRQRYGQEYPSQWVLGNLHFERHEDIQLDDQFVPWAFFPLGNQNSLQVMSDRAIRRIQGKLVSQSFSRYADFDQVGLPLLSFDSFANQGLGPSGQFGEISHGVSELSVAFGLDGFTTRYKIQSYFPQFGKEAPLGEKIRAQLNGIINPIDFMDLELLNNQPPTPTNPIVPGDHQFVPPFFDAEQRAVRVSITQVNNAFTLDSDPDDIEFERYRGIDQKGYTKPPKSFSFAGGNKDLVDGAICIDGFLNIDDDAVYHTDQFELPNGTKIFRYFTQGRPFSNSTIVQVQRFNNQDSTKYDVTIVDPTALDKGIERAVFGVQVLNGSVSIGDKTTLSAQGDTQLKPGPGNGALFMNGTINSAAGVTPVEIISVSQLGTNKALATCQELGIDQNGIYTTASGQTFFNVVPIPFREMATSGARGFLATITNSPSGGFGQTSSLTYVEIITPPLYRFG